MPLSARDAVHEAQIESGTMGRLKGHEFEKTLTDLLNSSSYPKDLTKGPRNPLVTGNPALELIKYVCQTEKIEIVSKVKANWLGGLATYGQGDSVKDNSGVVVKKSKSDILIEIHDAKGAPFRTGVSVKTCDNPTPTNDQLFLSTAVGFCNLLRSRGIKVSSEAENALRMFCGDPGFRPTERLEKPALSKRLSDHDRFFWEELPQRGRDELEETLARDQRKVTAILLQEAYDGDPYPPTYLLHQRVRYSEINACPLAIFRIEELIDISCKAGFSKKPYTVKKGRYKGDPNIHEAPRFGFVQFQRFGNVQNATELQFNLMSGYFNKIELGQLAGSATAVGRG